MFVKRGTFIENFLKTTMAYVGVSQYNHNQQIDEYEYDDTENFYDDSVNFGNYLDVDDSEGMKKIHNFPKNQ